MKTLLVETDHVVRDRVKVALQQYEGTSVDTAEDSWALELAKENVYDLLVIDDTLQKPGDGLQILRDLRAGGVTAPLILLSKTGEGGKDREGVNASAVLRVPPDPVDLFKALTQVQQRMTSR